MRQSLLRIAALLLIAPAAHATGIEIGTVKFEYGQIFSTPSHPGYTFFSLAGGTRTDRPACATVARWVINNAWPAAKFQVNVLLAAALTGKRVRVQGTGDCAAWGDTETVWDVHLED
jgi:hypothetical protein